MIGVRDRLELPHGVAPGDGGLVDDVRGITLPLNETGLALVGAGSIGEMAERAAARFRAPPARALRDAHVFALELNRRHLLNVRVRGGPIVVTVRWLVSGLVLVRHGSLPRWPARRRPLDTTSSVRAALGAAAATLPSGAAGGVVALVAPLAAGLPPRLAFPAAAAIAAGVAVHEAGHALRLRGVPAFVGRRGARVAVVHRALPARRTAVVALGGPLAGSTFALVLALAAWCVTSAELAVCGLALAPQGLALTMIARDGRRACAAW